MRFLPIVIFFLYIYLEISFFVAVANGIGVFLALLAIITTSIIGLSLVKSQGLKNFILMQQKMANNENPTEELVKSVSLLMAGFFLLIPGFLTDIIGAVLLLPPVQKFVIKFIVPKVNITSYYAGSQRPTYQDNNVIEGEFKHKDDE